MEQEVKYVLTYQEDANFGQIQTCLGVFSSTVKPFQIMARQFGQKLYEIMENDQIDCISLDTTNLNNDSASIHVDLNSGFYYKWDIYAMVVDQYCYNLETVTKEKINEA